ncbi:MAG: hypothetical protein J6S60_10270 [Oscillospiraceae bacterium]|nr:hypothetical protein [Oscillospiraceae bacterium]
MSEKRERTISAFEHENSLMHYGMVNKRSMIMLISVCVTFVLITLIFVIGYTVREKNWLNTLARLNPAVSEVAADGVHQQPDP